MEFQDQRPGTGRQATARPTSAINKERLLTATSSSPHFQSSHAGPYTSPTRSAASEIGSLPRLPTARPVETHVSTARPTEYLPVAQSQAMPPPPFLVRDEAAAPREVMPTRPSTSQLYRSYTTPSQPLSHEVQELSRRPWDRMDERPSDCAHDYACQHSGGCRGWSVTSADSERYATVSFPAYIVCWRPTF